MCCFNLRAHKKYYMKYNTFRIAFIIFLIVHRIFHFILACIFLWCYNCHFSSDLGRNRCRTQQHHHISCSSELDPFEENILKNFKYERDVDLFWKSSNLNIISNIDTKSYLGYMISLCFSSDSSGKAILVLFFSFSQKIIANFICRSTSYLASSLNLLPQRSTTREGIWNNWSTGDVVFLKSISIIMFQRRVNREDSGMGEGLTPV